MLKSDTRTGSIPFNEATAGWLESERKILLLQLELASARAEIDRLDARLYARQEHTCSDWCKACKYEREIPF